MTQTPNPEMQTFKQGPIEVETVKEGPKIKYSYYHYKFDLTLSTSFQELTDEEVLTVAEKAGTFDFLHNPDEDIYTPSDGTPI